MQPDLFTKPDPHELTYATELANLVAQEETYRIDNGIVPPWVEADFLLDKSERRLLELIEDHAGYIMRDDDWHVVEYVPSVIDDLSFFDVIGTGKREVSGLTLALGMNAEANSKAVVNSAIERGLITEMWDSLENGNRLDLTRRGRYYLDLVANDEWWELDE